MWYQKVIPGPLLCGILYRQTSCILGDLCNFFLIAKRTARRLRRKTLVLSYKENFKSLSVSNEGETWTSHQNFVRIPKIYFSIIDSTFNKLLVCCGREWLSSAWPLPRAKSPVRAVPGTEEPMFGSSFLYLQQGMKRRTSIVFQLALGTETNHPLYFFKGRMALFVT